MGGKLCVFIYTEMCLSQERHMLLRNCPYVRLSVCVSRIDVTHFCIVIFTLSLRWVCLCLLLAQRLLFTRVSSAREKLERPVMGLADSLGPLPYTDWEHYL